MPYFRVCLPLVSSPDAEDAKRLAVNVMKGVDPAQLVTFLEAEQMTEDEIEARRNVRKVIFDDRRDIEEKIRHDIEIEQRMEREEREATEGWEPNRD